MPDELFTSGDIAAAEKSSAEASPAPHPSTTESTAAAPITQPAVETHDEHGPVPFERHEAILGKTRREYEDRLSRLEWAQGLDRERVHRGLELDDLYQRQPDRLYQHLSERTSKEPKPDRQDEHGNLFYSPEQADARAEYRAKRLLDEAKQEFGSRLAPIEAEREHARQLDGLSQQIASAASLPAFTDHVDAMTEYIADGNRRRAIGERVPIRSVSDAYMAVVVPKLAASRAALEPEIRKAILAEMNSTSARTKDDLNPGRAPAASHTKPTNFKEALEQEFSRAR